MKPTLVLLAGLVLSACSGDNLPTTPSPPKPPSAFLVAMVVDPTGRCILGATLQVVSGQRAGSSATQKEGWCDIWSDPEIIFNDLVPGVDMAFKASAPGYQEQVKTLTPTLGEQMSYIFTLSRIPIE